MAFMGLYIQDARCGRLNVGCVGVVGKAGKRVTVVG
jgi:hypothetical protein